MARGAKLRGEERRGEEKERESSEQLVWRRVSMRREEKGERRGEDPSKREENERERR